RIGFIFSEQQVRSAVEVQTAHAQSGGCDRHVAVADGAQRRFCRARLPGPGVAQDQLRDQVQDRRRGEAVPGRDFHQNIAGLCLRVLDEDIEVTIVGEYAGVQQFVFWQVRAAAAILSNQVL